MSKTETVAKNYSKIIEPKENCSLVRNTECVLYYQLFRILSIKMARYNAIHQNSYIFLLPSKCSKKTIHLLTYLGEHSK